MAVAGSLTYDTAINTSGYQKGLNEINGSTQSAMGQIKNIVTALGIDKIISASMDTIKNSVDSAMKRIDTMDQFNRVMTAMSGSAEQANKALSEIKSTVTGTAYGLDVASRSAQKFVTSGMSLEDATKQVKTWADAVSFYGDGTNATFENVTDALSQMVAKGKVEMDQLNRLTDAGIPAVQIYADSVGRSVQEVQDDLSYGRISAQEFMDGLSEAFNKGTSRFSSITNAAKDAGASWSATFDNMQASVTRGMQNIIESIDDGLDDAGLPKMRELISDVGNEAEKIMNRVAKKLPGALKNTVKFITQNSNALLALIEAFISFKAVLTIQSTINSITNSFKRLTGVISANPWGIAIAGVTALFTALYSLANRTDEYEKKLKKEKSAIDEVRVSQEELNKQAQQTVSQGMSELSYYESLYLQLQTLVDANGKIKEGYQDRVNFITSELSNGLGLEINMTNGIISNYQDLSNQFNEIVKKKRAMITLNAQEEQYTEAIKNQADAYDKLAKYSSNVEEAQRKLNDLQEEYKNIKLDPLTDQATIVDYEGKINKLKQYIKDQKGLYDEQSKIVEEYSTDIAIYEKNLADFQAGNYDEMTQYRKNYLSNLKLDSGDELQNLSMQIESEQEKLEYLKSMKKKYNTDIYNNQIASSEQRINQLKQQFEQEKNTITAGNQEKLNIWLLGLSQILSSLSGKQYEFKVLGDGTVQMYIDGVKSKEPIAIDKIEKFGNNLVNKLNKKAEARNSGENIAYGVAEGISAAAWAVKNSVESLASNVVSWFNSDMEINSPSGVFKYWSKFIPEGVAVGIKENTKKALEAVDYMDKQMIDKVKNSVTIETGNVNANLKAKSTLNNNNVIQINATFTGEVDMDSNKVGRMVTPVITKTLKAGGLR